MRYVIVSALSGEALKFHEQITTEVCSKFNVRRTKLPGHITLKAPFDTDNIDEIISLIEGFTNNKAKAPIYLNGYGSFREDVIFIKTSFSKEAKEVYDELENLLKTSNEVEWKQNELGERVFHVTIVSKKIKEKFNEIWEYVNQTQYNFNIYFDNISIYVWKDNTWVLKEKLVLI